MTEQAEETEVPGYAALKLAGIERPVGFVIIGRNGQLSDENRQKLTRRNVVFQGSLEVMTFDDLLARRANLLGTLRGSVVDEQ